MRAGILGLFFFAHSVLAGGGSCAIMRCSYGELAQQRVWHSLQTVATAAKTLIQGNMTSINPGDDIVPATRKVVLEGCMYVDLFSYAYPASTVHGQDRLMLLNRNLLHLASSLDYFDSMAGIETVTPKQVQNQRQLVVGDAQVIINVLQDDRWVAYLSKPTIRRVYPRERHSLEGSVWAAVPVVLPSGDYTGIGNIASVVKVYLGEATEKWRLCQNWTSMALKANIKKLPKIAPALEIVNRTQQLFPEVWKNGTSAEVWLGEVGQFHGLYEALEGAVAAYGHWLDTKDTQKADAAWAKVWKAWISLTDWQHSLTVDSRFEAVADRMDHDIIPPTYAALPDMSVWGWVGVGLGLLVGVPALLFAGLYGMRTYMTVRTGYEPIDA